jgi:hypothetical protein
MQLRRMFGLVATAALGLLGLRSHSLSSEQGHLEVRAARNLVEKVVAVRSTPELIKLSTNETAFAYAMLMNLVLSIRAKGGVGPSTAEIGSPDPHLQAELEKLGLKYRGGAKVLTQKQGKVLYEKLSLQGRHWALETYHIGERAAKRQGSSKDPFIEVVRPVIRPDTLRFQVVSSTRVLLRTHASKPPVAEARKEQGMWRFHYLAQITAVQQEFQGSGKPTRKLR